MCDILELQHSEQAIQLERMVSKQIDKLFTSLDVEEQYVTLSTLRRIFDSIIQHPNDVKYRQIQLNDESFNREVWQYPAGEDLMKMSGWVLEGDHVRLKDESCVQIVSQLLKSFMSSSATGVLPFPDNKFQVLIKAFYNGDIACIQKLLKVSHISRNGRIYSESGLSFSILKAATITQQIEIVKLLLTDYHMDPYEMSMSDHTSVAYIRYLFPCAPQSFILAVMNFCGVKTEFKTRTGYSLLYIAVIYKCIDVVCFLIEECSSIDVNVTDHHLRTPLHAAYLCGHIEIAQYLIQHGADLFAVDRNGCTPYDYIDGDPDAIRYSEYLQNRRKIHFLPYSIEYCYFMKLINIGINDEEAVSVTIEQFPLLKEDGPTPSLDIDHASSLKEFTQYITNDTQASTSDSRKQPPSEVQGEQVKILTDNPWRKLSSLEHILF